MVGTIVESFANFWPYDVESLHQIQNGLISLTCLTFNVLFDKVLFYKKLYTLHIIFYGDRHFLYKIQRGFLRRNFYFRSVELMI